MRNHRAKHLETRKREQSNIFHRPTTNTTCQDYAFSTSAVIDCPDGLLYDDSLFSSTAVEDFAMSCEDSFKKSLSQVTAGLGGPC